MSPFPRDSAFAKTNGLIDPAPPETVKRVVGRQIVEEPIRKEGRTVVATDDLEAWYDELDRAASTFGGTRHGDKLEELRDAVYRYLR